MRSHEQELTSCLLSYLDELDEEMIRWQIFLQIEAKERTGEILLDTIIIPK